MQTIWRKPKRTREQISLDHLRRVQGTLHYGRQLWELQRSIHRIDENECNRSLTPREENRRERLVKEADSLAALLGLKCYHQSDPRGCALYLIPREWDHATAQANYPSGIACCD